MAASVSIPWGDPVGGNIVLTGVGTGLLSVSSDTPNTGETRERVITLRTSTPGLDISEEATVSLLVRQKGLREPLRATDGDLTDNTGSKLLVLIGMTNMYR